jgi:hypothetical protein
MQRGGRRGLKTRGRGFLPRIQRRGFIRPVGAAAVSQLEILGSPGVAEGTAAAGGMVPDGPGVDEGGEEVEDYSFRCCW